VPAPINRQVILKSRPSGIPQAEHFDIVQRRVPEPGPGQLLVRNIYLSVDPAMRGWVSAVANYSQPVAVGDVMRAYAAGRIEASRDSRFQEGEYITGQFGWQDYAVVDPAMVIRRVVERDLPLSTALGVLGTNGLTAYFGLLEVGQPRAGETVVVSTAAGQSARASGRSAGSGLCAPSASRRRREALVVPRRISL
jgi:NADPH-dependent curcumin reductase CurA